MIISDGQSKIAALSTLKILDPIVKYTSLKHPIDRNSQGIYSDRDQEF